MGKYLTNQRYTKSNTPSLLTPEIKRSLIKTTIEKFNGQCEYHISRAVVMYYVSRITEVKALKFWQVTSGLEHSHGLLE